MNSNKEAGLTYPTGNAYESCMGTSFLKSLFSRCRERNEIPDLVINNSIKSISKEVELLNTGHVAELSPAYLAAMEAGLPDAGFRYALIYKDNVPALFVYFQLFTLSTQNFRFEKNTGVIKSIVRFMLQLKKAKVLISGNALRTETQSYCFDARAMTHEEAIAAIAGIAEKLSIDECATAVILKDMPGISRSSHKMLGNMGYSTPWDDQVMEMAIKPEWATLQDYTAVLGRKYKARAKKVLADGSGLRHTSLSREQIVQYQPRITALFTALVANQSFTLSTGGAENFADLKEVYKDAFEVVGFFKGEELVAFYSAFINEDSYELYYAGFDYALNNELQLYFNILFAGLEQAIALRKKLLKLGRTSFDAKASLGAAPRNTDYRIKLNHIPDLLVSRLSAYFSALEDGKWKLRNPIK